MNVTSSVGTSSAALVLSMYDSGFDDMVCVIPPAVQLSPASRISPAQLGKIPGRRNASGLWSGYDWRDAPPATRDAVTVWLNEWDANIGMRARGFPAVDIDLPDADLVARVQRLAGEIIGPASVRTGKAPKALRPYRLEGPPFGKMSLTVAKDGASLGKIEILANGQQYVINGTHPSGNPYTWNAVPTRLAPITRESAERFLNAVRRDLQSLGYAVEMSGRGENTTSQSAEPDRSPTLALIEKAVRAIPNMPETDRDTYVKMCHLVKGSCAPEDAERGLELFQRWSAAWGGNDPAENARVYSTANPKAGWFSLREWADRCGLSLRLEEAQAAFAAVPLPADSENPLATIARSRLRLFTVQDLLAQHPPRSLIEHTVPEHSVLAIFGESGAFKSFITLDMALSIAAGISYHGRKTERGTAVYVCAEGFHGMRKRVEAWASVRGISLDDLSSVYFIGRAIDVRNGSDDIKALREELAKIPGPIRLVVLDTLNRNLTGNENASEDMRAFIAGCDEIRNATGAAIAVVHHTGHMDKSRSRGHSSFTAALDTEMRVERQGNSFAVALSCTKQKDSEEFAPMHFLMDRCGFGEDASLVPRLAGSSAPMVGTSPEDKVKAAIRGNPGVGSGKLAKVSGIRKETALNIARKLVEEGWAEDRGKGGVWAFHVVPEQDVVGSVHDPLVPDTHRVTPTPENQPGTPPERVRERVPATVPAAFRVSSDNNLAREQAGVVPTGERFPKEPFPGTPGTSTGNNTHAESRDNTTCESRSTRSEIPSARELGL